MALTCTSAHQCTPVLAIEFAVILIILPNIHLSRAKDRRRLRGAGLDPPNRAESRALTEQKLKAKRLSGDRVRRMCDTHLRDARARARLHGVACENARVTLTQGARGGSRGVAGSRFGTRLFIFLGGREVVPGAPTARSPRAECEPSRTETWAELKPNRNATRLTADSRSRRATVATTDPRIRGRSVK